MADTTKSPKKSRLRYIPRKAAKATTVKKKPAKKPETERMKAAKKARLRYIPRSK